MKDIGLFLFMLIGLLNGIILSAVVLLSIRSTRFLQWISFAIFFFSLSVIREFLHFFREDLSINSHIQDLFYVKLFIPAFLITGYNIKKGIALKNNYSLFAPGIISFLVMLLFNFSIASNISIIGDSMPIAIDCISFLWLSSFYFKNSQQLIKEQASFVFFKAFTLALFVVFFTRVLQLTAILLQSDWFYNFHFHFRIISISIIVYVLSITLLNRFLKLKKKNKKESKENLDNEKARRIILKQIQEDQKYLEHNLTLEKLAAFYKTDSKTLTQSIKAFENSSFNDYLNRLRIEHFMELVANSEFEKKTIFGLAQSSGFNSKATFNRAFKQIYKSTPSQYIKENFK